MFPRPFVFYSLTARFASLTFLKKKALNTCPNPWLLLATGGKFPATMDTKVDTEHPDDPKSPKGLGFRALNLGKYGTLVLKDHAGCFVSTVRR